METEARARGVAGWARGRALGDGVCGSWAAATEVPSAYTRMTAYLGRIPSRGRGTGPAPTDACEDDARRRATRISNRYCQILEFDLTRSQQTRNFF